MTADPPPMDDAEPYGLAQRAGELESQLALAVDLVDIAIWRYDFASQCIQFNAQGYRILGLPPSDDGLPIARVTGLVHPDDRRHARAALLASRTGSQPVDLELRYRHSDGQWRTVMTRRVVQRDASGRAVAFIGVGLDITRRQRVEQALRTAAERAALAARGAGLGTWEMELDTGEVHWDEQMWRLRGHAPRARAMDAAERMACVHQDDRAAIAALFHPAIAEGRPYDHHFRIVRPDGQVRWLASRSVELQDDLTGVRRRIGVNWDVTDRHTADAVRREHEIALRESAAKSKFLARMSHELRTPLNAVLGFAQLLLAEDPGVDGAAAARRRRLESIRSAGQQLLNLIDDVLDLTRLEGGEVRLELRPAALAPLVAETLPLLEPLRESRSVTLRTEGLDRLVLADATRLRQVLLQLLSNAVTYSHQGGEVTVAASEDDDGVLLRVQDTGPGMTEQQLCHLFEPFNRLGDEGGAVDGTGIGLSIAKVLMERMGSTLRAESTPGQGSVFELRLRAATSAGEAASLGSGVPLPTRAPAADVPAPARPRRTVLYIEDNPVNALIITELLSGRGDLALHVATDGASGVAQAVALAPDLILLDMQLPDCDGFEVLRRLRARPATAGIRCVALSANAMSADIDRALRAGMTGYWTKPLDFRAFEAALDALLGTAAQGQRTVTGS